MLRVALFIAGSAARRLATVDHEGGASQQARDAEPRQELLQILRVHRYTSFRWQMNFCIMRMYIRLYCCDRHTFGATAAHVLACFGRKKREEIYAFLKQG